MFSLRAHVSNGFGLLMDFAFPFLLLAQAAVPQWIITWGLGCFLLGQPASEWETTYESLTSRRVGQFLVVYKPTSTAFWVVPLLYVLYTGHVVGRRQVLLSAPPRLIMQVSAGTDQRRFCTICEIDQDDRMYHCDKINKCLRMFNHTCTFFQGPVYLENAKAYILFVFFLTLDLWSSFGIGVWAATKKDLREHMPAIYALFVLILFSFCSLVPTMSFWWSFVLHNVTWQEENKEKGWQMSVYGKSQWFPLDENPWDLGRWENVKLIMGPPWTWLFFWLPTPAMKLGQLPTRAGLEIPMHSVLRGEVGSTGCDEVTLSDRSRRLRERDEPFPQYDECGVELATLHRRRPTSSTS